MSEDVRYLRKNIRTGNIDVHPTEKALVVNYEMQATLFGELGYSMGEDKKECQKIIRVKNLDHNTNIPKLAQEIIENCKLIPSSKLPEVEHLLTYLLTRKEVSASELKRKANSKLADPGAFDSTEIDMVANLNDTDDYMDLLYEEIPDKLKASALILQLARIPDNLEELYDNGILIGALARVLKEDWKESTDLATNIIYIFFCFSSFTNFHQIIIHFKIGALTMNILDYEIKKHDMWMEDLQKAHHEHSKDLEKLQKKFEVMVRKQEQLFRVSYYLLLNIAEDVNLEVKMLSKNLIDLLGRTLERKNSELLILVVSFLKKLSVYKENLPEMLKHKIVEKLARHIPNSNIDLLSISLRLLYNLSFNDTLRTSMVKVGLLNKLTQLLDTPDHTNICLCILYNISCDDTHKPEFLKTECIPFIIKAILDNKAVKMNTEAVSLAINLVLHPEIANIVSQGKGARLLMKKAYKTREYMIMKMMRNISQHEDEKIKMRFVDYISDLAEVITDKSGKFDRTFVVECVGILSNLTIPDLDFEMILTEFNLVDWIKETLQDKNAEDDLLLQVIMLVGTVANDDNCAKMVADSGIIQILIDLITVKQEDDEIVCQIVYVFYQLIFHQSTRKIIVNQTQAPAFIIDLMHDKNAVIRKVCEWTLDIISEFDKEWASKIQLEKFKWYNSQWLEMIEGGANTPENDTAEDGYLDGSSAMHEYGYPIDADDLLSRYGMLMNQGILNENGVLLDPMGSPSLEPGYMDEFNSAMYLNSSGGIRGFQSELPFERPENQMGFRRDKGVIEHSGLTLDSYGNAMFGAGGAVAGGYGIHGSDDDDVDYGAHRGYHGYGDDSEEEAAAIEAYMNHKQQRGGYR